MQHLHPHPAQPLYGRIRDELRQRIHSGAYRPHEQLPSESALMTQYSVSRITVRQALGELEKEGVLFKVPGKGAYVSKPKPFQQLARLQGFAEAMREHGHEIYNRLLGVHTTAADATVAARLQLAPGTPVTELRRVRLLNREPVSLDITWVPSHIGERLAREDLATRDVFVILENDYGIALGHADLAIDAQLADTDLASHLALPTGAPLLRIERLTHDRNGTPLDFEYLYCRSDNFQFRLRVDRQA
ncbi:GntR family transcriptional regulator [Andreprevotia lacus DSM 23236]|jgi:GntR family transcriptional regulator|uniref:GntR family transcriptional regulator n=1 Tax=Andreprevotia lacus DSM 23236 TaxID=1121001 RepID=A0A1W1XFT0_9NEIS|nr:GntR family transcriptional regulator [Andreprevotia lacus]SMC22624.1 GntR family transcriptional regulator [Andreprevotia lacus DSM 23236]